MGEFPVALVTDYRGLAGPAICLSLAHSGFSLLINGPEDEVFELQSADVPGKILALPFDPNKEDSVQQVILAGLEIFGHLDVLVNNLYNWQDAALGEIGEEMWAELWQANLKATFYCCRSVAPVMQAQEFGKIINVTTTSCFTGAHLPYAAVSASLHSLTKSLARELAPHVRVNTVACGMLDEPWIDEGGPELRAVLTRDVLLGRLARPSDVAEAVAYLAGAADFVTGQMLVVDGGETMR